ncbi:potassium channel family protein [Fusibacter ferrireducens]|uniref:Two pore domain potassium channel family protein n=1 Tax=Fusibacter ferrireducens TaxID=2785058 RepID=A0ABR9ZZN9_9FIRM|nr:potassium channel family protein [Fusibacter ferrireducens]MBF4695906.1 two pore domain potassium channel family protein [Fusibacter ferrireducens]
MEKINIILNDLENRFNSMDNFINKHRLGVILVIYPILYMYILSFFIAFLNYPFDFRGTNGWNLGFLGVLVVIPSGVGYVFYKVLKVIKVCVDNTYDFKAALKLLVINYIEIILMFAIVFSVINLYDDFFEVVQNVNWINTLEKTNEEYEAIKKTVTWIEYLGNKMIFEISGMEMADGSSVIFTYHNVNEKLIYSISNRNAVNNLLDSIYFSTVTITTAGYGDISPNGIVPKIIVISELLIGQFLILIGVGITFHKLSNK